MVEDKAIVFKKSDVERFLEDGDYGIEVNSNKFTFTAYDGKDVEFDVFCDNIEADVLSYL